MNPPMPMTIAPSQMNGASGFDIGANHPAPALARIAQHDVEIADDRGADGRLRGHHLLGRIVALLGIDLS